ncbi:cell division protein FtsL [Candidatus Hoaglandella endobia]|uniref:Cell division protein FtsL n=1 Tax=Candidatus Hoaglandella endobia TaxID=1778263 RepID=A0A143WU75_9ENTR|nr:cell division protein FtsL [Candidatus Hoaglandella endobia]CUX97297.1 Cell division protein FtsL [Candidatus Hoaglandella endobia]
MIGNKRHRLTSIIGSDLLRYDKLPLLLLISVLISAILVITTTYQTRRLTAEREQIGLEQNLLDIEWRNLILEENTLGGHSGIEHIATEQLKMQYVDQSKEHIVVQP